MIPLDLRQLQSAWMQVRSWMLMALVLAVVLVILRIVMTMRACGRRATWIVSSDEPMPPKVLLELASGLTRLTRGWWTWRAAALRCRLRSVGNGMVSYEIGAASARENELRALMRGATLQPIATPDRTLKAGSSTERGETER